MVLIYFYHGLKLKLYSSPKKSNNICQGKKIEVYDQKSSKKIIECD